MLPITPAEAAAWINCDANDADLVHVLAYAVDATTAAIDGRTVPDSARRLAILHVAADVWESRLAPAGVRLFADGLGNSAPIRVRSDHVARARASLGPWLPPTID